MLSIDTVVHCLDEKKETSSVTRRRTIETDERIRAFRRRRTRSSHGQRFVPLSAETNETNAFEGSEGKRGEGRRVCGKGKKEKEK